MKLKLHWQIIIAMVTGSIIGLIFNNLGYTEGMLYNIIVLLGDIFVRLLKMVIVPLIFTSIVMGVSSISDKTKIGRLGFKTLATQVWSFTSEAFFAKAAFPALLIILLSSIPTAFIMYKNRDLRL